MPDIYISNEKSKVKSQKSQPKAGPPLVEKPEDSGKSEPQQPEFDNHHRLPGHSHNPLSSFFRWPEKVAFETQEKDEKVVLLLRRHPITNVPWIVMTVILILAPTLLQFFPLLSFLPDRFQFVALFFWYLIVSAFVIESFLTWFFNVYIVTDERVVDVDFYNLIYKEVSDAKIDKIQDVTYNMGGVVRTLFNYGDVAIQTAGTVTNFQFEAVPGPAEVAKILQELRTEEEQEALEGRIR